MTSTELRLLRLEQKVERLIAQLARLAERVAALEQAQRNTPTGPYAGGGGGQPRVVYWCRTPAALVAATGTWASLTSTTFTADLYEDPGAGTPVVSGATVHWWYKDAAAINKLVAVAKNADGSFHALHDSCTAV